MNCRLPIVTAGLLLAAWLPGLALFAATPDGTGQSLLRQAAQNLSRQKSLQAQVRQTVDLFGQYLVGSGSYRQLIIGDKKMFRLELKLQVGDTTTSFLQVSDGETLWEKRDLGSAQKYGDLSVRHIRDAAKKQGSGAGELDAVWLKLGGLDLLLRGLDDSFHFDNPIPERVGKSNEIPVWILRGRWKKEKLEGAELAGLAGGLAALPDHLPHLVTVTLGRDDQLPLFPYRIEYLRRVAGDSNARNRSKLTPGGYRRITTIQLYEVQHYAGIDAKHFAIQSEESGALIDDLTDDYLRRLGLKE